MIQATKGSGAGGDVTGVNQEAAAGAARGRGTGWVLMRQGFRGRRCVCLAAGFIYRQLFPSGLQDRKGGQCRVSVSPEEPERSREPSQRCS